MKKKTDKEDIQAKKEAKENVDASEGFILLHLRNGGIGFSVHIKDNNSLSRVIVEGRNLFGYLEEQMFQKSLVSIEKERMKKRGTDNGKPQNYFG